MSRALSWFPVACAAAFPLHPRATTPVLILWAMTLLVVAIKERPVRADWTLPVGWWGGPAAYALVALGLLWTEHAEMGKFALEVKGSLLVVPLVLMATERWVRVERLAVERGFLFGLVASAGLGLGDALVHTWTNGGWEEWRYAALAGPLHPTYLAWYWSFGLLLWARKGRIAGVLLASAMIGLLASKAAWLAGAAVLLYLLAKNRSAQPLVALVALTVAGWWAGSGRAVELVRGLESIPAPMADAALPTAQPSGSTSGRMQAWSAAWELLLEHPAGVGTGSTQFALDGRYAKRGAHYAASHHMNAHNAYLESAVTWGWGGVCLLLAWWSILARSAWQRRDEVALWFIAIAAWIAATESVFELQSGVVWLAFGTYLWSAKQPSDQA